MSDPLDRAVEELRAAPVPPGPPAEVLAATVAAVADRAKPIHIERRRRIMRIVGYGSMSGLAAGLLVAVGLLQLGSNPAQAVDDAVKRAKNAKSVRIVYTERRGDTVTDLATIHIQGTGFRIEKKNLAVLIQELTPDGVTVLTLEPKDRTARLGKYPGANPDEPHAYLTDPLTDYRKGKDWSVRETGKDTIDGCPMRVYDITGVGPGQRGPYRLWVDATSGLPARMRKTKGGGAEEKVEIIRNYQDWNGKFDPKLFDLTVPEGYTLIEVDADGSPKRKKDEQFVVFRAAVDAPEKAKSYRAVTRQKTAGAKETEHKLFFQSGKMRIEFGPDFVSIADLEAKKSVMLDGKSKIARVMDLGDPQATLPKNVAAAVKKILDEDGIEDLGEKILDGRKTRSYRIKGLDVGGGKWDVTYWIDAERKLPVRYEMAGTTGAVAMTQTTEYFGFDEELDPKLFDMTIPEGYKVEKFDRDALLKQLREKAVPAPLKKVEPIAPPR